MASKLPKEDTTNIDIILNDLTYVKSGGEFRGWKLELLTDNVLSKSEKRLLVCSECEGLLREAILFERKDRHELRCLVCVSERDEVRPAFTNREVINERQVSENL